jgi:predicted DNA-binding antitoxin AbrB/MazE fold protein
MNVKVDAIYDNGVLRPLTPLLLPDQSRVTVTVDVDAPDQADPAAEIEARRLAIKKLFDDIDKLPQPENKDGWSAKNHDEVLYGWKK